jgi:fructose-specific component phosphotransferase system IIB-like protein
VGIYVENQNHLELICFGSVIQSNAVLTGKKIFNFVY